jgi:hypothetical protein
MADLIHKTKAPGAHKITVLENPKSIPGMNYQD